MRYSVIYADPPWNQKAGPPIGEYHVVDGKQGFKISENQTRSLAYETMTVEQIKAIPVRNIAGDDAHLYIWVTNAYLPYVFDVIRAWGFTYSTTIVWAKNQMGGGLGGAFGISTEYLIFARRGKLKTKARIKNTWFNIKRAYVNGAPVHSKKPEFFAELIEKVSPGPYLEMFARSEREGWDVFGNQVNNSIKII